VFKVELTRDDTRQVANLIKGQEATITVQDDGKMTIKIHQGWLMVEIPMDRT
jgi:hypothetical protein